MTKTGWWYVKFELTLEGEDVRWEDLDECTQEYIAELIKEGYVGGEICIEEDDAKWTDSVGGIHEDGCGWAPNGDFCGECSNESCENCSVWRNIREDNYRIVEEEF